MVINAPECCLETAQRHVREFEEKVMRQELIAARLAARGRKGEAAGARERLTNYQELLEAARAHLRNVQELAR